MPSEIRPERWMAREVGIYDDGSKTFALIDHAGRERALGTEGEIRQLAASDDLLAAVRSLVQIVEQLIPEPSARGVADVVLFQGRAAIARAEGGAS